MRSLVCSEKNPQEDRMKRSTCLSLSNPDLASLSCVPTGTPHTPARKTSLIRRSWGVQMEAQAMAICAAPRHDYMEPEIMQLPSLNLQDVLEHMHTGAQHALTLTQASHTRAAFPSIFMSSALENEFLTLINVCFWINYTCYSK